MVKNRLNLFLSANVAFFALSCILLSCESSSRKEARERTILIDPYIQSFWNKNIKILLHNNPLGGLDTIFFDKDGNITEIHELGAVSEKMLYAKNHAMIQYRVSQDVGLHYLISYDTASDIILQHWTRIMKFKWNFDPEDVNRLQGHYSVFTFDEHKRLIKEINLSSQTFIHYLYQDNALKQKEIFRFNEENPYKITEYAYKDTQLLTIREYDNDSQNKRTLTLIHYYNEGKLDSTQRISIAGKLDTDEYKYIYFNDTDGI